MKIAACVVTFHCIRKHEWLAHPRHMHVSPTDLAIVKMHLYPNNNSLGPHIRQGPPDVGVLLCTLYKHHWIPGCR